MLKQDHFPVSESSTPNSIELLYPVDYKEHTGTRLENDRRLLPLANEISSGKSLENLERFARACLGMYLDMDNSIPPADRIHILASPQLVTLVHSGFAAVLKTKAFASPEEIARSTYTKHLAEGYILLAALELFGAQPQNDINILSPNTLSAAICFSYAYKNEIDEQWLHNILIQRPDVAIQAFTEFWLQLIAQRSDHLPGVFNLIRNTDYDRISRSVLLPVLKNWLNIRKKLLRDLLRCALRTANHNELYPLAVSSVSRWNTAEPGRYILWLTCAFLLHPKEHQVALAQYTGRTKEKLIPLLDFTYWLLHTDQLKLPTVTADACATLIRLIAAKITPQKDRYGELCDNTRKVMFLFYCLACAANKQPAIEKLLNVRVMKLYQPILKFISTEIGISKSKTMSGQHDEFLTRLEKRNLIQPRIKWFD